MKKKSNKITIYTDGGCDSNPGGRGGYGAVIIRVDGREERISGGFVSSTNNRMEIIAVVRALGKVEDGQQVVVHSDSKYVINTMQGLWEQKRIWICGKHWIKK